MSETQTTLSDQLLNNFDTTGNISEVIKNIDFNRLLAKLEM